MSCALGWHKYIGCDWEALVHQMEWKVKLCGLKAKVYQVEKLSWLWFWKPYEGVRV